MPTVLLLSTSDTDLITARASGAGYRWANPSRLVDGELEELLVGADVAVVRILGGYRAWQDGIDTVVASGVPTVVVSGEQSPDAELMGQSTTPAGVALQAHIYLAQGGLENLRQLYAFLCDTLLMTGFGFEPPVTTPNWGVFDRPAREGDGPTVAVLYYRAQHLAGNTGYIEALCGAIEDAGGRPLPVFCASLRTADSGLLDLLATADAMVTTVLAAGGATPATVTAGGTDDSWNVAHLAALDIPILQGLCLTSSRTQWHGNDDGMSPLDVATQVAVPEFDGRIITVPFSFKEIDGEGLISYVADPERCARVAGLAIKHARLRAIPATEKRVAVVFSAYPTKHARIGNAVGLDTPASAVALLRAMRDAGYRVGEIPGVDAEDGDALVHALIERGGQDPDWLTDGQLAGNPIRVSAKDYRDWFATLPQELTDAVVKHWGPPPGELFVDRSHDPDGEIVIAALQADNVVLMVQPPRGFGENPVAIYHDPDLPPSHQYLGRLPLDCCRFRRGRRRTPWQARQPGVAAGQDAWHVRGMRRRRRTGQPAADLPVLGQRPGGGHPGQTPRARHAGRPSHPADGARRKLRRHRATRAAARRAREHRRARPRQVARDPPADLDADAGGEDGPRSRPGGPARRGLVRRHAASRRRLAVRDQGRPDPRRAAYSRPDSRRAVSNWIWCWPFCARGSCSAAIRPCLGCGRRSALPRTATTTASAVDAAEATARELVAALQDTGWDADAVDTLTDNPDVARILKFAAAEVVPRLAGTSGEIAQILRALDGRFIAAGPSGSPLRGLVNVLPTGRNFYSVDPKAVPSRLAWETGVAMADSLLARYRDDYGDWPQSVGLSVWGTSAMRTSGDDIAEVLALLGVRPVWDDASRRVVNLEPIPLAELGRPRIDVTVRISGFFRDAFPHVVTMLDDAVQLVANLDEPAEDNYVRAHAQADLAEHGDERRSTTRIFGSKPGTYGAGLLAADRQPQLAR